MVLCHGEKPLKTLAIHTSLWMMLVLYLGQIGIYIFYTLRCSYPSLPGFNDPLRLMIVSDMHLLGHRRKSYLQRLWVDWQLSMALQLNIRYYQPQVLIFLGDQFDEGGRPTVQRLWDVYARRLDKMVQDSVSSSILSPAARPEIVYVLGNHDSDWGRKITPGIIGRFERSFGLVNDVVEIESERFIKINAMILGDMTLANASSASSPAAQLYNQTLAFIQDQGATGDHAPILLSHIPLYRPDDLTCGSDRVPRGHVTYTSPDTPYLVGEDVLPRQISHQILNTLKPGYVLSGHTHAYCHTRHDQHNVTEVTLSTFGWGMRPDPSFGLALVKQGNMNVKKCALPVESQIFQFYGLALILLLVYLGMSRRHTIWKKSKPLILML